MSQNAKVNVSRELGIQALVEMAHRRGLHASLHEAERSWSDVTVKNEHDRLGAAWRWLFKKHTAAESPIHLLSNAQLPAWVVGEGCVGILIKVPEGTDPAEIEWIDGSIHKSIDDIKTAIVPVSPLAAADESFLEQKKRGPATVAILGAMRAHASIFRRVAVASIFINVIAILSSLFVMQVYDRVVPNFAYATLWFLASGVFLAYVIDIMFKVARLKMMEATTKRMDEALSLYVFDRLLGLKLDRRPSRLGTLVAQVRDYESVKAFFTSTTLFAIVDLPFIFIFIGVIYLIAGPVALVPTVFVFLCLIIGIVSYKPTARLQQMNNDAIVRRQGLLYEAVAGGEVVKSQGGEGKFSDSWLSATRETTDRAEALNNVTSAVRIATGFFQNLAYIGIVIVGVYVIEAGELTMGGLIACSILGSRALSTIANIASLILQWHHAKYSLGILNQLLSNPSDDRDDRQANVKSAPLDLRMQDMVYAYEGSELPQLVIPAINIPEGSRVAVLGKNGSGKSTLLKLFAAIATPARGQTSVAGLDYEECRPSWLREVIGYLPQDPRLFSGTLLENLTLGMSMPDESLVYAALEKTGLLEAVTKHPQGLQLPIREGGAGMSGGQRQLVGLTRIVLQNPKIWLLDEPTANLDSTVEQLIAAVLTALPADRTVIFTTHRQSWLRFSERVLFLEDGQVKADLPTSEVVKASAAPQTAAGVKATAPAVVNVGGGA